MIEVHGLTKYFGPRLAIDDISFKAEKGEILGFLGPNGAGKTTTMRILTGFMPPNAGEARIAGFDVLEQSMEVRRRVGYMPESVPLYPDMTVFDYLKFMADLRHLSEAEDWVDEILELVHMENRSDSYISSLSKGMRQRVGLAQALLHKPDVLILDEPTIGLDPAHIIDVRKIIQNMGKDRTVLLSTHILSEAQQVCDRVLIINKGKIVAEDSPKNLQSRVADAQQIYLQIGGNLDNLEEIVTNVEGVTAISGGFEGKFEIQTSSEIDARPEIARAVIKAGYDLLELKPLGMDLEEIFLELTQDDQKLKGKISEEGKSNA